MEELIILVDKDNNEIGYGEKQDTHEKGLLHRAFSIFIFNDKNELLLQQRAKEKYHCGGLRTNTVCSHPRKGETYEIACHRRLIEEVGFDCNIKKLGEIIYNHKFENGLSEHEYDTVFMGIYNNNPKINPDEIMDYKWIKMGELIKEVEENPKNFTPWFKDILNNFNFSIMTTNKQKIYTDYLSKLEDALNLDNFDSIDYILEYIYSGGISEEMLIEIDDILQEATLYSELKEQEYKVEALEMIGKYK